MEPIQITRNLKQQILNEVAQTGLSPTAIIEGWKSNTRKSGLITSEGGTLGKNDTALVEYIDSLDYRRNGSAIKKYLGILSHLYQRHSNRFDELTSLEGQKRVFFAKDRLTITRSGVATDPKNIPGTEYWAMSKLSNKNKRDILFDVLHLFGYEEDSITLVLSTLASV